MKYGSDAVARLGWNFFFGTAVQEAGWAAAACGPVERDGRGVEFA